MERPLGNTVLLLLLAICGTPAIAQTSSSPSPAIAPARPLPLGPVVMDDSGGKAAPQSSTGSSTDALNSARATSDLARQEEAQGHYFDAAQKYESILTQAPDSSDIPMLHLMKAAAHMDAARCWFYWGQGQTGNPAVYKDNLATVSHHLEAAQKEIEEEKVAWILAERKWRTAKVVASSTTPPPDVSEWKCTLPQVQAQSFYLEGMLNNTPADLDKSIQAYQDVARCEPSAKAQVDSLTSYIGSVRRQMSHSPLSGDAIMKDISDVLHLLGTKGDFVSLVIQKAYEYHQSHQTTPSIGVP